VARCHAIVSMPSAWLRDSASAQASWSAANSLTTSGIAPGLGSNPSSGLRRNNMGLAAAAGPVYVPNGLAVSSPVAGAAAGSGTPPGWFSVIHASIRSHQL
jgi:hypothetical protein